MEPVRRIPQSPECAPVMESHVQPQVCTHHGIPRTVPGVHPSRDPTWSPEYAPITGSHLESWVCTHHGICHSVICVPAYPCKQLSIDLSIFIIVLDHLSPIYKCIDRRLSSTHMSRPPPSTYLLRAPGARLWCGSEVPGGWVWPPLLCLVGVLGAGGPANPSIA